VKHISTVSGYRVPAREVPARAIELACANCGEWFRTERQPPPVNAWICSGKCSVAMYRSKLKKS